MDVEVVAPIPLMFLSGHIQHSLKYHCPSGVIADLKLTFQKIMTVHLMQVAGWGPYVVSWLWNALSSGHSQSHRAAYLQTFGAWVKLGCVDLANRECMDLMQLTFSSLMNPSTGNSGPTSSTHARVAPASSRFPWDMTCSSYSFAKI